MATAAKIIKKEEVVAVWSRIAFLWAATLAVVVLAYAAGTWSTSFVPTRTIFVSADSKATIKPDIATITFSVLSEGASATAIQADNTRKVNDAIAVVKALGVDAKDIQTSRYHLSPKYTYNQKQGKSSIEGYEVTQTVTVKVRNVDDAPKIVSSLPGVGVNHISGPVFSVEDAEKYLASARTEAFVKARAKAQALARAAGVGLGRVVTFSESSGGFPPPSMHMSASSAMGGEPPIPNFEPGMEEANVSVSVTFEIR